MDPAHAELPIAPPMPTLAAALRARAAASPERPFLRFEEETWTFADAGGVATLETAVS